MHMLYFLGSFHKSGDKMKNKNYHTFGTGPKSNRTIVERDNITQTHNRPLSWLGTGISIKSGGVKLVLWTTQTPLLGK